MSDDKETQVETTTTMKTGGATGGNGGETRNDTGSGDDPTAERVGVTDQEKDENSLQHYPSDAERVNKEPQSQPRSEPNLPAPEDR